MLRIWDYAVSLHYTPIGASVVLPCIAYSCGFGWLTCATLSASSLFVSIAAFAFEPLSCLAPMGGRYHVGLKELNGNRGAMLPPISVFYPTTTAIAPRGEEYIPFHDTNYMRGMAQYARVPYILLKDLLLTRVMLRTDAAPVPLFAEDGTPHPIILFSHGLAGYARLYSTLLMDLAARGAIVFAVAHMDASGAYCRDNSLDLRIPFNPNVGWKTEDREPQLEMRIREARNTIPRLRSGDLLRELGYDAATVARYLEADAPIHLAGHSFGGATVLAVALEEEEAAKEAGVASTIATVTTYDPWMVPLRGGLFHDRLTDKANSWHFATPSLQIFSEAWIRDTVQYEFFKEVQDVVEGQPRTEGEKAVVDAANKKLQQRNSEATWYRRRDFPGTSHLSCTDSSLFSAILFRPSYMTVPPRAALVDYAHDTAQFIKTIAGPIPIERNVTDDPVLAAALQR